MNRQPEWMPQIGKLDEDSMEIFGTPIFFVDGMASLKDIHRAYCKEAGITGAGEVDAKAPRRWRTTERAKALEEFLVTENPSLKPVQKPKGDRRGLYACRELAHDYAGYLDVRYAVIVLRAFDYMLSGKYAKAQKEANKVARRMLSVDHMARMDRLANHGMDARSVVNNMFGILCLAESDQDVNQFMEAVIEASDVAPIFKKIMDVMETELVLTDQDYGASAQAAMESLSEEHYNTWGKFIKEYAEK